MKIRAREFTKNKVALDCKPLFGAPYTVYAQMIHGGHWLLPSGRLATKPMLDAIDRRPDITWDDSALEAK